MKTLNSINYLLGLLVATSFALAAVDKTVKAKAGLRVRSEPSTNGKQLALIKNGAKVSVIEETGGVINLSGATGRWTKIKYSNVEGWAFGGFLTDTKSSPKGLNAPLPFDTYDEVQTFGFSSKNLKKPEYMEADSYEYSLVLLPKGKASGQILFSGCAIRGDSTSWQAIGQIIKIKIAGKRMDRSSETFCPYYLTEKKGVAQISDTVCINFAEVPQAAKSLFTEKTGKTILTIDSKQFKQVDCP